jgi:hypothetical protein
MAFDEPIHPMMLDIWMETLIAARGPDILRLKAPAGRFFIDPYPAVPVVLAAPPRAATALGLGAAARMVAIGYADNRPLDVNTTPEGRTRNRRVNVLILNAAGGAIREITLSDSPAPSITTLAPPAAR